jgi:AAA family ATP:ADP antiporter
VKTDYLNFMGRYSTLVGTSSFIMMFVGAKVVDSLGWRAGALMTPGMMGLLALPFFACITFGGTASKSALMIAVYVGLVQNVLSKVRTSC